MRKTAAAFLMLALSSCTVHVPPGTTDPAKFSVETFQKARAVTVAASVPAGRRPLSEISATSCMRYSWDPEPTNELALVLLKAKARDYGATGVAGVTYRRYNISLSENCKSNIVATGTAFN